MHSNPEVASQEKIIDDSHEIQPFDVLPTHCMATKKEKSITACFLD